MDESATGWRAGRDLRSARLLAAADDPPLDTAILPLPAGCGEIHQGLAPRSGCPIPKTHDLLALVKRASESHPDFTRLDPAAAMPPPDATAFRSPGGSYEPMPTREEFDEALDHADAIHDFVVTALPADAPP